MWLHKKQHLTYNLQRRVTTVWLAKQHILLLLVWLYNYIVILKFNQRRHVMCNIPKAFFNCHWWWQRFGVSNCEYCILIFILLKQQSVCDLHSKWIVYSHLISSTGLRLEVGLKRFLATWHTCSLRAFRKQVSSLASLSCSCCKQMPSFPSETCCFYAKALSVLSSLPLLSHHRGTTTTNFPFSPRTTAAEILLKLKGYMRKTMNQVRARAFF